MRIRSPIGFVVAAVVALSCDWLGCEEPPLVVAPRPEVPPAGLPAQIPMVATFDAAVAASEADRPPDAGAGADGGREPTATVHFQLSRAGQRTPGVTFRVEGPRQERDGRLTDVMGVATLELAPGNWRITQPRGAAPHYLRVAQPDEWIQVQLPPARSAPLLEGTVVDEQGAPVPGARVTFKSVGGLTGFEWVDSRAVTAGADGRFTIAQPENGWCQRSDGGVSEDVEGCHVGTVSAEQGHLRSVARVTSDSARDVRLVLARLVPVDVRLVGPPGELCGLSADVGDQGVIAPTNEFPWRRRYRFWLPRGPVVFRACVRSDPPTAGRLERDLRDEPSGSVHELQLREREPVRGVVLAPDGGTLAGVEVGLASLFDRLDRNLVGLVSHGDVVSTFTDSNGQFRFELSASRPGPSRIELFGAWQLDHPVLVHADDPPLTLSASPRPSQ